MGRYKKEEGREGNGKGTKWIGNGRKKREMGKGEERNGREGKWKWDRK